MTIGPQVVQPPPAAIVTRGVRTKVLRGVDGTGTAVRERHGIGPSRRRWSALLGRLFTQGTGRLLRQARERFRLAGAAARGLDGVGWPRGHPTGWARPEIGKHDAQPE